MDGQGDRENVRDLFRILFDVFASFSRFSDLLGPAGTCSDALGYVRMRLDVFGHLWIRFYKICRKFVFGIFRTKCSSFSRCSVVSGGAGQLLTSESTSLSNFAPDRPIHSSVRPLERSVGQSESPPRCCAAPGVLDPTAFYACINILLFLLRGG